MYKAFELADKTCKRLSGKRKLLVITDAEVMGGDIHVMKELKKRFFYINGLVINSDNSHCRELPFKTHFVSNDAGSRKFRNAIKNVFLECLMK